MRLVVARCSVDYAGRLEAHLPEAVRVLMVKADGSVLVHADGGSYKPLNWMSPPCSLAVSIAKPTEAETADLTETWVVTNKAGETLTVRIHEVHHDSSHELGTDPGLVKDGVEAHLQKLLAEQVQSLGVGWSLV
ncbi:MAG: endonuclease, partial [Candidatus Nanopelagicales bacterium]